MSYKEYIDSNTVILVGNGINRLESKKDKDCFSWEAILKSLNKKNNNNEDIPKGYPLTEYVEIINVDQNNLFAIKKEFIEEVKMIKPSLVHHDFIDTCIKRGINILTTNFDHALEETKGFVKGEDRSFKKGFTNYYPWQRYYIDKGLTGIRIWHINGDLEYANSIKLSVSDYAGCITYYKHFNPIAKNSKYTKDRTWINEIMEKNIIIIGLSLSEAEIFLRHILIQRFSYSKKIKSNLNGYYFTSNDSASDNKLEFFLKSVGIDMVSYPNYNDVYNSIQNPEY